MQDMPIGPVALRCRRRTALRREQRLRQRPQHRLDHRKIDPCHAACPATLPQRGRDDEREHQPAHRIEPGEPHTRRDIGMAVQPGKPRIALQQRAIGDGVRFRTGPPQARRRHIDQLWVAPSQCLCAKPKPVHHAGRKILHQHVASFGERSRKVHRRRLLQIEHDTALGLPEHGVQPGRAAGIAAAWRLDLDHIGAHRREIACRRRAGDHPTEVEHAHAGQRQGTARLCRRQVRGA